MNVATDSKCAPNKIIHTDEQLLTYCIPLNQLKKVNNQMHSYTWKIDISLFFCKNFETKNSLIQGVKSQNKCIYFFLDTLWRFGGRKY